MSSNAASSRAIASSRMGRGVAKLRRSHVAPPGPNCSPGLTNNRARSLIRAAITSAGKRRARQIDPRKVGGIQTHRPRTRYSRLNPPRKKVAIALQIRQQCIEPSFTAAPPSLGRQHPKAVVRRQAAGRDPSVELRFQNFVRCHTCADVRARQIERLGGGDHT